MERLDEMTDPYGPQFPLDPDIEEQLAGYPGEMPRDFNHYVDLLCGRTPPAAPAPAPAINPAVGAPPTRPV